MASEPLPVSPPIGAASLGRVRDSLTPELSERLLEFQVSGVFGHFAKASVISTVLALALVVYLTPVFGATHTQTWFVLKAASAATRFAMAQAYRTREFRSRTHLANRLMILSLFVDGAIWGLAGVWGSDAASEIVCLLVACLASVAMLATFGLQLKQHATAAYVVPMLLPMVAALAWRGDALGAFGACGTILVLAQTLITGYASEKRLIREFIAHEETARALRERSEALQLASTTADELQASLERSSKVSSDLEQALQEVQRQGAVKALFLGTMSHELRTPLHGILGLTELLQQQISDPIIRHRLDLIEASGTHLLELIGALLDISRIDSGRLELHPAPFDLSSELHDLADLYEMRAHSKGIGFRVSIEVGDLRWVRGDRARIRQVLHNLLGNAIKFTQKGLISLRVHERDGLYVFEIADTGTGIAASDLAHIFEAFRQVDATAARPADGTGLGLTIARELARAMGGDIKVSSALDVGSRFAFSAQLENLQASDVPTQIIASATASPHLPAGCRILLVEDNEVNALIAMAHLDGIGAQTTRAHDGVEALNLALSDPRPELILMDCRMPLMDGPTATREIRAAERDRGLRRIPIVALTASPSDDDRRECRQAGMDGILAKPFTLRELLDLISIHVLPSAAEPSLRNDPLYDLAMSLDDMEPDLFWRTTLH